MSLAVDLLIVVVLIYAAYVGTRRGAVLIALEFVSFALATFIALLLYHLGGGVLKSLGLPIGLANIAAFSIIWVAGEILSAILIRVTILKRLTRAVQVSRPNQIGGAALNAVKFAAIIALMLIVGTGLPIAAAFKAPITNSSVGGALLRTSTKLQGLLAGGLGRDLGDSLNFFTVSSEAESQEHIDLGFKTTNVKVDAADEDAMLVLINRERTSRGLPALRLNPQARIVARAYSTRMFAEGYFSHIDSSNHNPFDRLRAAGVEFGSAGENLALAPTLELAHQGLMNSPGHRANILSSNYRTVGIGIIDGGQYGLMVTQEFTD